MGSEMCIRDRYNPIQYNVGNTNYFSVARDGTTYSRNMDASGSFAGSSSGYGNFSSGNFYGNGYFTSGSTIAGYGITDSGKGLRISSIDCDRLNFFTLRGWHEGTPQGYYTDATLRPSGWTFSNSDIRLKENIEDLGHEFDQYIYNLPLIKYTYIADKKHKPQAGVNANLLMKTLPDYMARSFLHQDEKTGLYGANYELLVPYAIKAIQDLNERLKELENGKYK